MQSVLQTAAQHREQSNDLVISADTEKQKIPAIVKPWEH